MERKKVMGVFKKQGIYWIDFYGQGHRKWERIGPDKRLAETVFKKRKVEIAEGKFLEKKRLVTTTFGALVDAYLPYLHKSSSYAWPCPLCLRTSDIWHAV